MGVFKKFRGGYAHEAVQADYYIATTTQTNKTKVPTYKDTTGTAHDEIMYNDNTSSSGSVAYYRSMLNWALPYRNMTPVPMSTGLYESALGLTYDSTKTYYTDNTGEHTADMSGYSAGETITDSVYYCTYDVEDYDIEIGAVGGTQTVSRAKSIASLSASSAFTISIVNDTQSDMVIKSVKFWGQIAFNRPNNVVTCNVLKCAYYLDPSEYVTIPAGETGAAVVVLDFGITN